MVELYWDKGKQNGKYYLGFRVSGLGFRIFWVYAPLSKSLVSSFLTPIMVPNIMP